MVQEDIEFMATRPPKLKSLMNKCQALVHVAESSIPAAGQGLVASQDIQAGSILTFYPVHALTVKFRDGSCFIHSKYGYDHKKSAYLLTLIGKRPVQGIDLERDFDGKAFIDADPNLPVLPGWQCHFINDGATIQENSPEKVMEYYVASFTTQNAIFLPFGPSPLCAAMATKDIAKGQEIFTCYGRSYWLTRAEPDGKLWSPRTEDIILTEKKMGALITEATEYLESKYFEEEMELYQAFDDTA